MCGLASHSVFKERHSTDRASGTGAQRHWQTIKLLEMTPIDLEHLATTAAETAVQKVLLTMGVNVHDPEAVLKMQLDFAHLREWRETTTAIKSRGWMVLTGLIISGIAAAIVMAVKGH